MELKKKIYVAGHTGMVGSALVRKLQALGYTNIVTRSSAELDLRNQAAVQAFFKEEQPAFVFMAAAKVGGIHANNTFRADFIYDNIMMEANVIHAAYQYQVEKLLFLGSSCIYPKLASQPLKEAYLLAGQLESTNEPYAIAKIAGIKLCEAYRAQYACNFISAMPTNLYGPNDNYDLQNAHVLPALIRKFHEAKVQQATEVVLWGTGKPMREFMHVDDLAAACCFLMQAYNEAEFVNIGSGVDITIAALAQLIKEIVGYEGELINDITKPDGTPRKLMDVSKMTALGWSAQIDLESGIRSVYEAYKSMH
jgi:GDP-L-fucose synthase